MPDFPVAFHFKVELGASSDDEDIRFQEVTGLAAEVTTEELKEGGLPYPHRMPTGTKFGNLVLKRGMVKGSKLRKWVRGAVEDFDFDPQDVEVTLLDEEHNPLAVWNFTRAWPVKWSVSDLKAQDNALVVESLELAYASFRRG